MTNIFNIKSMTLNYDGGLSGQIYLRTYSSATGPIGFQSANVRYKQVAQGAESGFEQPDYDDSTWSVGQLPTGSGGNCPYQSSAPPNFHWSVNTDMLIRMDIVGPFSSPQFDLIIDNRVWIYIDGVQVAFESGGFCDSVRTGILPDISSGPHIMAFRCNDFGAEAYFDFSMFDGSEV